MKNKQLIYVLIPMVLIIWGLIIFRIIKHFHHSQDLSQDAQYSVRNNSNKSTADSSILILDYRDPFLHGTGRMMSYPLSQNNLLSNNNNLTSVSKPAVVFPSTRYSGVVTNSKNKHKVGLLKIDNKDFLAKEGEEVAGEKIIKLYKDSVIISFKKVKKTFFRN